MARDYDDEPYDDRERRPARRNSERSDDDDHDAADDDDLRGRRFAESKVGGPGTWLMIYGVFGLLLTLALIGLGAFLLKSTAADLEIQEEERVIYGIALLITGVLGIPFHVVIILGGSRMKQLRSYGLAMTAAILGIGSLVLFGLCGLFGLGIGIWALTSLMNEDVKYEFRRNARSRTGRNEGRDDE
jgi:hypothetical protein